MYAETYVSNEEHVICSTNVSSNYLDILKCQTAASFFFRTTATVNPGKGTKTQRTSVKQHGLKTKVASCIRAFKDYDFGTTLLLFNKLVCIPLGPLSNGSNAFRENIHVSSLQSAYRV